MGWIYLIPAVVLWTLTGGVWLFDGPDWLFWAAGVVSGAATGVGIFIAGLASVGPRF